FRYAAARFIRDRHHRCFGDLRHDEACGLQLLGAEAVTGDVDDVVDAAEDAEVAFLALHRPVAGEVRPVLPLLRVLVLVVLCVIGLDEAIGIFPDRLHDPRPWIANADVARLRSGRDFLAFLVVDDRMDSGNARTGAARLHRIERRFRAAEEPAGLGLPPRIDDDRLFLADDVVIPAPDFR